MKNEKTPDERQGTIVDVRTHGEFSSTNIRGVVNIPLPELKNRLDELKKLKQPLILCSDSGRRSQQAYRFLSGMGIECYDGGSCTGTELF